MNQPTKPAPTLQQFRRDNTGSATPQQTSASASVYHSPAAMTRTTHLNALWIVRTGFMGACAAAFAAATTAGLGVIAAEAIHQYGWAVMTVPGGLLLSIGSWFVWTFGPIKYVPDDADLARSCRAYLDGDITHVCNVSRSWTPNLDAYNYIMKCACMKQIISLIDYLGMGNLGYEEERDNVAHILDCLDNTQQENTDDNDQAGS